jgi:hypothetical protein
MALNLSDSAVSVTVDFTGTGYWKGYLIFVLVQAPVESTGYFALEL